MGINPTQPNHKAFTFDGTSSRDYGVYITGEGVFNAPQRDVQMVDIPGRNGAYALDKGNFNNITVKYPASIVADNETDFAEAVSDLRNFLCSKTGYCRLEDEYNPNEYRMAIYKSGLEVSHDMLTAGEFDITFECKPQRWLKSGETAVTMTSGNDITNPTLFDARPQLQVYGYGDIDLGGEVIEVNNVPIGDIIIYSGGTGTSSSVVLDESNLNVGDSVTVDVSKLRVMIKATATSGAYPPNYTSSTTTDSNSDWSTVYDSESGAGLTKNYYFNANIQNFNIVVGTDSSFTNTTTGTLNVHGGGRTATITFSYTRTFTYTASTKTLAISESNKSISSSDAWVTAMFGFSSPVYNSITGHSTVSTLGNPVYIDLDIGECWNQDSGTPVSINNAVNLPAELPTLPSGNTTITFNNTVTQLDIVPRWWIV